MAIVSTEGLWIEVNPALCQLFGHQPQDLVGTSVQALSLPDDLPRTQREMQRLLGGDQDMLELETRYLHADGRVIEVMLNAALMRNGDGHAGYVIAQFRDMTAQRKAERGLQELNASHELLQSARTQELEVANRHLEAFVHGVAHDLRAPLRSIDGFATQLARSTDRQLNPQAQEHLQRIRAASTRMGLLIDGLLELASINRAELRATKVDVSLLAEWALAELRDAQPQRDADVQVQQGLELVGDERLLKAMLGQVLTNAWRFSSGRVQVWIRVEGEREGDGLHLSIRDRGIGFDMAYSEKLFEPFQRLHGSDEGAGTGIGLTIAQQVAMRHGGRIRAEAEPGSGACFHLKLHDQAMAEVNA